MQQSGMVRFNLPQDQVAVQAKCLASTHVRRSWSDPTSSDLRRTADLSEPRHSTRPRCIGPTLELCPTRCECEMKPRSLDGSTTDSMPGSTHRTTDLLERDHCSIAVT